MIKKHSDYLYVFLVKTGNEEKAVKEIGRTLNNNFVHLKLLAVSFFRKQGKVKKETKYAFPGYVFITTEIKNDEFINRTYKTICRSTTILKLLRYGDTNEAAIRDEERESIDCLWQGEDCIEASTGIIVGNQVFITDGPLKGREDIIKEIHPRSRQAVVEIGFMGGVRKATVALEIIDRIP